LLSLCWQLKCLW